MLRRFNVQNGLATNLLWYDLWNSSNGYIVKNIEGIEPVEAEVSTTVLAGIEGVKIDSALRRSRNIVVTLGLQPTATATIEDLRREAYADMMVGWPLLLIFEDMDGTIREARGTVESNQANRFSKDPEQVISFICYDPDFIKRESDIYLVPYSELKSGWSHTYTGTSPTGVAVSAMLNSSIQSGSYFRISNRSHVGAKRLTINQDISITPGQNSLSINTAPGYRRIDLWTSSLIGSLSNNHEWGMLMPGPNTITLDFKGSISDSENVMVSYTKRWGEL